MAVADYYLEVDWGNDGHFASAYSDVSDDLLAQPKASRGRQYGSMIYGRSVAGQLVCRLRNTNNNRYDRFNNASPLHELVVPGRLVRYGMRHTGSIRLSVARGNLTAGTELIPTGGTLLLDFNLTIDRLVWSSTGKTLTMYRKSGETKTMATFWSATSLYSLYIVNDGGRTAEIPVAAISSRAAASVVWTLTADEYATQVTLLNGIASGDKFWLVVDFAGLWLTADGRAITYLWGGQLDNVQPIERRGGRDDVQLRALGILADLTQRIISSAMMEDIKPGAAIELVLDGANIPDSRRGTIDDGIHIIARWWAREQAGLQSLREIEETELGFVLEDRRGRIGFEAEYSRLNNSQLALDIIDEKSTSRIMATSIAPEDPIQDIANIIKVPVRQFDTANEAVIWTMPTDNLPVLESGQTRTIVAEYPTEASLSSHIAVDSWTALLAGTDYVVNSTADGLGTNLTTSLTVTVTDTATSRTMELVNDATPAVRMYVTTLQSRGVALTVAQPFVVQVRDESSIESYGRRDYLTASQFLNDEQEAYDYGLFVLHLLRNPTRKAKVVINMNDDLASAASIDLSDRVRLSQRGTSQIMFVESITHRVSDGKRHDMELLLSPSLAYGEVITLGPGVNAGPGLGTGVLGR